MSAKLTFLGTAGTVTGSKYLFNFEGQKILIDCGLFQGLKFLRQKNWSELSCPASEINAVLLTHAHIDHSGYIPRLIRQGFRGKIYATTATREVCGILLPDCGQLQEEEATYLNKHGRTKHRPALPLFSREDAEKSLDFFKTVPLNQSWTLGSHLSFEFRYAGHILGAASVLLRFGDQKIIFTGDVGRMKDPIFSPPAQLPQTDYLVTESTYGNKKHESASPMEFLEQTVRETYARRGVLVIPSFAVGRAQALMYYLWLLKKANRLPEIPMYLNSPMAIDFNRIFGQHRDWHRLSNSQCREIGDLFRLVKTPEESKALNDSKGPMLIISASGMLTGGRVLHHLKAFAPYPENTILLAGFQAEGTRGRALIEGKKEIKIHGEFVPVRAQVKVLDNISSHADADEMIQWFQGSPLHPKKVFVTHGENTAAQEFSRRLTEKFKWSCLVPQLEETFNLE